MISDQRKLEIIEEESFRAQLAIVPPMKATPPINWPLFFALASTVAVIASIAVLLLGSGLQNPLLIIVMAPVNFAFYYFIIRALYYFVKRRPALKGFLKYVLIFSAAGILLFLHAKYTAFYDRIAREDQARSWHTPTRPLDWLFN